MFYFICLCLCLCLSLCLSLSTLSNWYFRATPSNWKYPEGAFLCNPQNLTTIRREVQAIRSKALWGVWTYSDNVDGSPNFTELGKNGVRDYLNKSSTSIGEGVPSWRVFPLIHEGEVFQNAETHCPKTLKLLRYALGKEVINAGFSCMEPGSRTPVHSDSDYRFYRMHIPIILPKKSDSEQLGLRVTGRVLKWTLGDYFIFDDTYEHQAWNDTDEVRIVLLVDVKRRK